MYNRITTTFLLIAIIGIFSCHISYAEDSDSQTYVFQLKSTVPYEVYELLEKTDAIYAQEGFYRTDDLSLIQELQNAHAIDHYSEDGKISLDGLPEELEVLKAEDYRSAMLGYDYVESSDVSGAGIKIGLIDSGLWSEFSNYSDAVIATGTNLLVPKEDENRNNTEDVYGHGTFAASIIAGSDIGLAKGVTIVPFKCFEEQTSSYSYVMEAIYEAVDIYECDIINLSLGDTVSYPDLETAVQYALDSGVIVIASTGNTNLAGSTGEDALRYPAAHEGVIAVGSVDNTKTIWKRSVQNSSTFVVAPGVNASGLSLATGKLVNNSGTSFSAPIVSATAALALSADPELTAEDFKQLLIETSEDLGSEGYDYSYGNGLINPALLLASVQNDYDSSILTYANEELFYSTVQKTEGENKVGIIAYYDTDGKLLSLDCFDNTDRYKFSNYLLSSDVISFKVFTLDELYMPGCAIKGY